jgi:hypothetical protein
MRYHAPYGSEIVSTESYRDSGYGSTPESRAELLVSGLTEPHLSLRPDSIAEIAAHLDRLGRAVARRAEKELPYSVADVSADRVSVVPAEWVDRAVRPHRKMPGVAMSVTVRVVFLIGDYDNDDVDAVIEEVSKMLRETRL